MLYLKPTLGKGRDSRDDLFSFSSIGEGVRQLNSRYEVALRNAN